MKPVKTLYRVADNSGDYKKCHALLREFMPEEERTFNWPTVVAERDGEIVGFLATYVVKGFIEAGPMVIAVEGHKSFVALRLVEAYENLLQLLGYKSYIFSIKKSNKKWVEAVERGGNLKPYSETEDYFWYQKAVKEYEGVGK
jgi:hypothetical protein